MKDNAPQEQNLLQYLDEKPDLKAEEDLLQYLPDSPQNQVTNLRANVFASTPIPPDTAAKDYDTFKQTKIPVDIVRAKGNEIKQMTELDSINYDDLVNNFPKTAMQLADPNKAGAIRDDIDNLSYFEKILGETRKTFQSNEAGSQSTNLRLKKMYADVMDKQLTPIEENELGLYYQDQQRRDNTDYELGLFKSKPVEYLAKAPSFIFGNIPNIVQTAKTALPAAAGGFVVSGGNPLGATVGGALGAFSASSRRMTADAYDEYKNLKDETGKPIEKQVAAGAALLTGGIGGAIELIPAGILTAPIRKLFTKEGADELLKTSIGRQYLKNIAGAMITEGAAEGAQEYSNIVFAEAAKYVSSGKFQSFGVDKDKVDANAVLSFLGSDQVKNRVLENTIAGAIGGGGFAAGTTAISHAAQSYDQSRAAEKDKGIISDIVNKVKESKIFKRSPELFKDSTENTLGEENVYLPADDIKTFFQTKSPDEIEEFYKIAPEARGQLETAIETGGNIVLKGNSAAVAFANEKFSGLQNFAKLSPETLNEKEAQDTFLNDAVSNVGFEEQTKKQSVQNDKVRSNIKNQILGLGLPKRESQDLMTALTSYYDTKSSRYGSEEAQKILDTYLGSLEVKSGVVAPRLKNEVSKDDFDILLNKSRQRISKLQKPKKPLLTFLKNRGGVRLGSNLAGELNALGINLKTAPGLFRKEGGLGDVDNIVGAEFQAAFPNIAAELEGDYVSRQAILDLLSREAAGENLVKNPEEERMDKFLEDLDKIGIELKNATNEEVKKAIEDFKEQNFFQTPQNQSPTFYSALEKSITDLPQGKGSPEQWQGIIKNLIQKGVKQEEIDWTGIQDWLKEQRGSVTKEQILDYLKANQIQVEEVVKGKEIDIDELNDKASEYADEEIKKYSIEFDEEEGAYIAWDKNNVGYTKTTDDSSELLTAETKEDLESDLRSALEEDYKYRNQPKQDTKFEKYTLPGGENYRELLLILPQENIERQSFREMVKEAYGKEPEELSERMLAAAKNNYENNSDFKNFKNAYKSSHYDEPNILAHIRFNERTDKDGNRVMFIEELQSDWHQEGRKKGYANGPEEKEMQKLRAEYDRWGDILEKRHEELRVKLKSIDNLGFDSTPLAIQAIKDNVDFAERWDITEEDILKVANSYKEAYEARIEAGSKVDNNKLQGVPDAPFKTTWNELAFKRALLWAVENGFDKVAWTTGEQQAERYDLSKEIDSIKYRKNADNTYNIKIIKNDNILYEYQNKKESEIEDIIGKEPTKKIIENTQKQGLFNNVGSLTGLDLKVGGEGMKAFYDKIVPTMVNKLVKKFGGKVEVAKLKDEDVSGQIIPDRVIKQYDGYYLSYDGNRGYDKWQTREEAEKALSEIQAKSGIKVHSLEITPPMRESIQSQGLPLFQNEQNPLGQTQFLGQKPIISLFKNKNRSTLLHELGHVFLQIESDIAKLPNISDQVKKDWKTIEEWLDIKDGKITTEAHEKFARGFEAYLREGKAPSIGLRNTFRRFKSWLTTIYKNVKSLNVELSKPIREVFDRMLATDEAIDELRNNPIYRADEKILALLDEEEKAKYLDLVHNTDEKTKEKLLAKSLKKLSREETKSYKEERQKVKASIEEELKNNRVYRAFEVLRSEDGFKINAADIESYEGNFINKLPKDIIAEDGVAVDMAADFLGFADGGIMLNELANAPNFKSEVNRQTNEAMAMREESPQEKVVDESQNDAQAKKILYELNATNAKVKTFIDTKEAYKQKAKDIIGAKLVKDATNSYVFYLAEIKAAREAGVALGAKDYEKAVEWKKKQLLNHYLYHESLALKDEIEDLRKRTIRYNKKPVAGKVWIEEDYRERIVGLLEDFGLVENTIGHQKTNISELEAWKKEQAQEGVLGLVDFSEISAFQDKDNIRNLTTDEFRTLDDAIYNLAHVGQGLKTLELDGKRVEIETIVNDIIELVNKNIKKDVTSLEDPTKAEKLRRDFDSYASSLIKTSQTSLKIDGEQDLGKFYNYFERPVNFSELKKEEMKDEAYKKFDEIYKKHFGGYKITNKRTTFEQLGKSYSKSAVLSFALNWGNEINRRRVRDGFNYSNEHVITILSSLTKNELEFVQDVWDMVNSYWPQVESTQKKLFGFAPKKQRAIPFTLKSSDGHVVKMKGGYYPIAFSKEASLTSDTKEDLIEFFAGSAADKISFHASYTKERSEEKISKKIDLTLNPLTRHISQVITDISMKEAVWNSYKIINNKRLGTALIKKIGLADYKQLQTWLYDMYGRTLVQEGHLGKLASLSRNIATTYAMGFKVATALIQITGILNSTVKLGYKNMGNGLWKALGNGNPVSINQATKLAFAKSKILEDRSKTINRDIYEVMDKLQRSGKMTKAVAKFAFFATTKAQMLVDLPTWYGGYYKGLKDFNGDDQKAAELADRILIETQGSSYKQSRSAIERNEAAIVKAFTVFYSYMNVKLNLLAGSYRKNNFKKPKDVAAFASDFMMLFFADALVTEFLREGVSNLLAGRDSEDDDEENKALHYANLIGQSLASSIPGVSQFYSGLSGYSFNPGGFKGFEIFGKGIKNLGTEAIKATSEDEEADLLKALRGLNDSLSIFTVGGGSQIDIFLRAQQEAEKGEDVAPIDYILKPKK